MTNGEASRVRACVGCGAPDAWLCRTTKGPNPGRNLRLCDECVRLGGWEDFGLVDREPLAAEAEQAPGDHSLVTTPSPVPAAAPPVARGQLSLLDGLQ